MDGVKVYLTGAEGTGWALDTEYLLARQALSQFASLVDSEADADVIHTVWPEATFQGRSLEEGFGGLPAVAALNMDPLALARVPGFVDFSRRHYHLVAQSSLCQRRLRTLGFPDAPLVPIIADLESYSPLVKDSPELVAFAERCQIPRDRYLVGLFQRDSLGAHLDRIKVQKGPDIFVAIMREVVRQIGKDCIHVVIGGPRRHWLRAQLSKHKIPFTFVGRVTSADDHPENILDKGTMNLLYNLLDLYLIPTRWEGAPRQVFDVIACKRKLLSTHVGAASDVLEPECVYHDLGQAIDRIVDDVRHDTLSRFVPTHCERVTRNHTIQAVGERWRQVYAAILSSSGSASRRRSQKVIALKRKYRLGLMRWKKAACRWMPMGEPRRHRLAIWRDGGGGAEPVFGVGAATERAFESRGITIIPQEAAEEVSYHLVDLGRRQREYLRRIEGFASVNGIVIRMPADLGACSEIESMIERPDRCALAFSCAARLGEFITTHSPPPRHIVLQPFFEVEDGASSGDADDHRREILAVPNEEIHLMFEEHRIPHIQLTSLEVASTSFQGQGEQLVGRLRQARVLICDKHTPFELMRLALFCGVPVVCDQNNPADEFGIGASIDYESAGQIPERIQLVDAYRQRLCEVMALPTVADSVAGYLSALDLYA